MSQTILVVDDEPLIRWSVGERLRAEGYQVLEAADGREAVDLAARGMDIILLGVKLLDMGTVAVLRHIIDRHPTVRVILMTADDGIQPPSGVRLDSSLPRASKPFTLDELVSLVKQTIAGNAPALPDR